MRKLITVVSILVICQSFPTLSNVISRDEIRKSLESHLAELKNADVLNSFSRRPSNGNDDPTVKNIYF